MITLSSIITNHLVVVIVVEGRQVYRILAASMYDYGMSFPDALISLDTSLVVIEAGGHPNFGGACQFLKQNVFPISLQLTSLQSATQISSVKSSKSDKVLCRLVQCQQQTPHKIKYHSSKSK